MQHLFCSLGAILVLSASALCQIPASWEGAEPSKEFITEELRIEVPALNSFMRQDARNGWDHRFAGSIETNHLFFDTPKERLLGGTSVSVEHISVSSEKGFALKVHIPRLRPGEEIYFYNNSHEIISSFSGISGSTTPDEFLIGPTKDSGLYVEYNSPWWMESSSEVKVSAVYPIYNEAFMTPRRSDLGFGAAKDCHNNINCPSADEWRDEKRGVVRIMVVLEEGIGWCSGSMVNNTAEDGTPYILSAFHCIDGFDPDFDLWRFDFNYEGEGCQNPSFEPNFNALSGCEKVSGRRGTDFLLLRLEDEIPVYFEAFFNGWDRTPDYLPTESVLIHHPRADIKKISYEHQPASIFGSDIHWDNGISTPPNSHYKVVLDDGIFEGGSSGAPLLDPSGLIIGQLHGGSASCSSNYAYSGRLSSSWNGNAPDRRLRDWLDPIGELPGELGGIENPASIVTVFTGYVRTPYGDGVEGVSISVDGEIEKDASTDQDGFFFIEDIPASGAYSLKLSRTGPADNGVSAVDIVLIRKDILGLEPFEEEYQKAAADVNLSGSVSAIDIVEIRKVVLGLKNSFTAPSWIMMPEQLQINNPEIPEESFAVTAIKTGDLNGSADLSE